MRNIIRRILILVTAAAIILIGTASAGGSSSATITSSKDGAWGSYFDMVLNNPDSFGNTYVKNLSTSTNTLWAAGQSGAGKEFCNASAKPGKSGSNSCTDILPGRYRVVLDPSGPLATGCNGSGSFDAWDN